MYFGVVEGELGRRDGGVEWGVVDFELKIKSFVRWPERGKALCANSSTDCNKNDDNFAQIDDWSESLQEKTTLYRLSH